MTDVQMPLADKTNRITRSAGSSAIVLGSTPGGPLPTAVVITPGAPISTPGEKMQSTPGGPTSTQSGTTVKETSTPKASSEETEATMAKRLTDLIRKQNQARRIDAK